MAKTVARVCTHGNLTNKKETSIKNALLMIDKR